MVTISISDWNFRLKNKISIFKSFSKFVSGQFDIISCEKEVPIEHQIQFIKVFKKAHLIKSMTSFDSPESQIRTKGIWYYFMVFNQLFNAIRYGSYIFLPNDEIILKYAGDLTQYYGGIRYFLNLPFTVYSIITLQYLLQMGYFNFDQIEWLRICAVLSGLPGSSFSKIGITDKKMAKQLMIFSSYMLISIYELVIGAMTVNFLWYSLMCYLGNFSMLDLIIFGLPYQAINLIWVYVLSIVAGSTIATFSVTCLYLKIRFKQVNLAFSNLNKLIKIGKKHIELNRKISPKLNELNRICILTDTYNKFFSILIFGVLIFLVPTTNLFLYNLVYEHIDSILIKGCFYFMFITCSFLLFITIFTAGLIESEARRLYPVLNSMICSNLINLEVRLKVINVRLKITKSTESAKFYEIYSSQ
jgi:hypothetical protein